MYKLEIGLDRHNRYRTHSVCHEIAFTKSEYSNSTMVIGELTLDDLLQLITALATYINEVGL